MRDFSVAFSHPYLLLLLIPAAALLVFAMLRVPKKYRNSGNRVVSVVLESVVVLCAVLLLAGMTFTYTTGNTENEVMLLVDVTETMNACEEQRDAYVQELIYRCEDNDCAVGVVTFGYTQVYAAPLTTDYDGVYSRYKSAQLPDTTATDLAAALEYSAKLFASPDTSRIVIISDGRETDESAVSVLTALASQGTVVESVYVPSAYEGSDIQIVGVETPDYHVNAGDFIDLTLDIRSSYRDPVSVTINVTDNGEDVVLYENDNETVDGGSRELVNGANAVTIRLSLRYRQLNAIRITMSDVDEEILTQNNTYCVYVYIDSYNKIIIFQPEEGQSAEIVAALQGKETDEPGTEPYDIITVTLAEGTKDALPLTVDELRQYDLVILNNTSNADMYAGYWSYLRDVGKEGEYYSYFYTSSGNVRGGGGLLPELLYSYVYTYGGGLLTTGGVTAETDENGDITYVANMYGRSDMYGTLLQQMLPVTAIDYAPPTGVVVLVDTSDTMGSGSGSPLSYAINGISASLDLLSARDYMGVVEFSTYPYVWVNMESLVYASDIRASLNNLLENPQSGVTMMAEAFDMAITMLEGDSRFERKHIIMVTDGEIYDGEACLEIAKRCAGLDITVSAIVVGDGGNTEGLELMRSICEAADGNGNVIADSRYLYDCTGSNSGAVSDRICEDIQAMVWEETNYADTQIQVSSSYMFSPLLDGLFAENADGTTDRGHIDAQVRRFYGTSVKSGASLILTGQYSVPIYAQWSYGEGTVGSLMVDVHDFGDGYGGESMLLNQDAGRLFLINAVDNLMPTRDIRPNGLTVSLSEDNYTNRVTVFADIPEGYFVDAKIYAEGDTENLYPLLDLNAVTEGDTDGLGMYVTTALGADNGYSRADFVIKESGVYKIVVKIIDGDGNPVYCDSDGNLSADGAGVEAVTTVYKKFSYSAEYDNFNAEDGLELLNSLSTGEYGRAVTDAEDLVYVFAGLTTRTEKTVDPGLVLAVVALTLFLLGIAARKFKFKSPQRMAHDRKLKKSIQKD